MNGFLDDADRDESERFQVITFVTCCSDSAVKQLSKITIHARRLLFRVQENRTSQSTVSGKKRKYTMGSHISSIATDQGC